jgi:hypothetical protein
MAVLEYTKRPKVRDSTMKEIAVTKNGRPFGMLWTWPTTRTETHPWHAQPLKGEHKAFYAKEGGLKAAKAYMEGHA